MMQLQCRDTFTVLISWLPINLRAPITQSTPVTRTYNSNHVRNLRAAIVVVCMFAMHVASKVTNIN